MTKRKYLRELRKALGRIPESEKEELIEYYAEIIDESYERGKTTREIFATLESPQQVASDYFSANEGRINERRRRPTRDEYFSRGRDDDYDEDFRRSRAPRERKTREKHKPNVLLTVLLFPLWFPVFLVAIVLALAVCIVVISLLIADVVLVVSFCAGGLYCLITSFGLFPSHGMIALAQIGAAVVLFGLAMMLEVTIKPLGRGVGAFFRLMFRRDGASAGAIAQSHWLGTFLIGLVLVVIGCGAVALGYHGVGSDWRNLAAVGEVTEVTEEVDLSNNAIDFRADNLRVKVVPTLDSTAKLIYTQSEELPMEYTETGGGVFSLKSGDWNHNFWEYTKQVWKRGILFSAVMSNQYAATLYLPVTYQGDLAVDMSNGALTVESGENTWLYRFDKVSLSTDNGMLTVGKLNAQTFTAQSHNGYIAIDEVNAETMKVTAQNGYIQLKKVTAGILTGETSNGAIRCTNLAGSLLTLKTSNGKISGSIYGNKSDYMITAKVGNGSCNLQNTTSGTKALNVTVSNGSIKLDFVQ